MGENTKIEWTDYTFNPWRGCSKVHEGCANCYAEREAKRFPVNRGIWGPQGTRVVASEEMWRQPEKWNRWAVDPVASATRSDFPRRPRVFCASLADVFEDWQGQVSHHAGVPMWRMGEPNGHPCQWGAGHVLDEPNSGRPLVLGDLRARLFALIDATPNLDWLLLTKRPENVRKMWCSHVNTDGKPPSMLHRDNVWLGTSISLQEHADRQIPELLECRDLAAKLFLSAEPLLGSISLKGPGCNGCFNQGEHFAGEHVPCRFCFGIDWVIAGGESGHGARPMHPQWARSLRDQCRSAKVPFFFKQWGEWEPWEAAGAPIRGDRESRRINDQGADITSIPELWCGNEIVTDCYVARVGKKAAGRLLDGREWGEFPPQVPHA